MEAHTDRQTETRNATQICWGMLKVQTYASFIKMFLTLTITNRPLIFSAL